MKFENAFSSFSVNDLERAKQFYGETLGLEVQAKDGYGFRVTVAGNNIFVYEKPDHQPATFTILNFHVSNIEKAVEELSQKGIRFEQYEGELKTDTKGIHRQAGMEMAWFKDPAGNFLSLLHGSM